MSPFPKLRREDERGSREFQRQAGALRRLLNRVVLPVLVTGLVTGFSAMGQAPSAPAAGSTNASDAHLLPPLPRSPVEYFRELLAMTDVELRRSLTNRTPESRELVLAKVREYKALPPEERDLRLKVTELRWYLLPLLTASATNRAELMAMIPSEDRKLVEARLVQWELLPPPLQQQFLENEAAINYLLSSGSSRGASNSLAALPPARRDQLEAGLRKLEAMSESERLQVFKRFREFFDFTPKEKEKILGTLSEPERHQLEKTLKTFANLTPDQRSVCIRSFRKFASLTPAERQQFFRNAERWKLMTPTERQTWRDVVTKLSMQPPLPPGFGAPAVPPLPPPMPRPVTRPHSGSAPVAATNQ